MGEMMELALPVATDTATSAPATETAPVETATPHADAVSTKEANAETIDLTLWAKTNKQAREYKAKVAELETQVKELGDKLKANPDEQTARQAALTDMLKQPGAAKKLLEHGWTFDKIVAELTDIPVEDPVMAATTERLDKVEKELADRIKAEKEAKDKQLTDAQLANVERARSEVANHVKAQGDKPVEDESDPRAGTPRWAIVSSRPDLHEEARVAVTEYISAKHPSGVTNEQAETLVNQALDQLEIAERKKLEPILTKIASKVKPFRTLTRTTDTSDRITPTTDPFLAPTEKPRTITSSLTGPLPTGKAKPGRYQGGPRQITYSD